MSLRSTFLKCFFKQLKDQSIPFCVLRNFSTVYEVSDSDVDVLVDPRDLTAAEKTLLAAARETKSSLLRRVDYTCRSCVFFSGSEMVHVDLEYSKRWRIFEILSPGELLANVRPYQEFFVPSPVHEALIVWNQAVAMGRLTDRYRARLAELWKCAAPEAFSAEYEKAYGRFGGRLLEIHGRIENADCPPALWTAMRRALLWKSITSFDRFKAALRFALLDAQRLGGRLSKMSGLYCHVICRKGAIDGALLQRELNIAYPLQKSIIREAGPLSLAARLQDRKRLFRGGLILEYSFLDSDREIEARGRALARAPLPWRHIELVLMKREADGVVIDSRNGARETVFPHGQEARAILECAARYASRIPE